MKVLLIGLLALSSSFVYSATIEGRLIDSLEGELDPHTLGDGCLTIVEYHDYLSGNLKKIGIHQDDLESCLAEGVEVNEEIDFDLEKMKLISEPKQIEALKDLTERILQVTDVNSYYEF